MKKIHLLGCVILSALLVVSCKSQSKSSTKEATSKGSTESEVTSVDITTESSDDSKSSDQSETNLSDEVSESVDSSESQEETTSGMETSVDEEVAIDTPSAKVFHKELTQWNIPLDSYSNDGFASMDGELYLDNNEMFTATYNHYSTAEEAQKQFARAVSEGEIYGVVETEILEDEDEPRKYVACGQFQFDEKSPALPDYYVIIQFDQEYIYLYGRGDIHVQKVKELVKAMDIELQS